MADLLTFPRQLARQPQPDISALLDPEQDLATLEAIAAPSAKVPFEAPATIHRLASYREGRAAALHAREAARGGELGVGDAEITTGGAAPLPRTIYDQDPSEAIVALMEDMLVEGIAGHETMTFQPIEANGQPLGASLVMLQSPSICYLLDILGYAGIEEGDGLTTTVTRLIERVDIVLETSAPHLCSELANILDEPGRAVAVYRDILIGLRGDLHILPDNIARVRIA